MKNELNVALHSFYREFDLKARAEVERIPMCYVILSATDALTALASDLLLDKKTDTNSRIVDVISLGYFISNYKWQMVDDVATECDVDKAMLNLVAVFGRYGWHYARETQNTLIGADMMAEIVIALCECFGIEKVVEALNTYDSTTKA